MFTGDPGPPGLPGLPGTYTVQIPHRVQKRDTGNLSQNVPKLNTKCLSLHTCNSSLRHFPSSTAGNKVVGRHRKLRRQANGG